MTPAKPFGFSNRLKAAAIHLCISSLIGILVAVLIFLVWYPWPYNNASGGQALLILLISVDLGLGPALTFVVFDRTKRNSVLMRDLAVIGMLQLAGLAYGLHTIYLARPVALVFEQTRFRVVTDFDVIHSELPQAEIKTLPLTGPIHLGTRKPANSAENIDSIMQALDGVDVGRRPSFWQPYEKSVPDILAHSRPLSKMYKQYPSKAQAIDQAIAKTGYKPEELRFLPAITKAYDWTVVVNGKNGAVVTFLPYDGFF